MRFSVYLTNAVTSAIKLIPAINEDMIPGSLVLTWDLRDDTTEPPPTDSLYIKHVYRIEIPYDTTGECRTHYVDETGFSICGIFRVNPDRPFPEDLLQEINTRSLALGIIDEPIGTDYVEHLIDEYERGPTEHEDLDSFVRRKRALKTPLLNAFLDREYFRTHLNQDSLKNANT